MKAVILAAIAASVISGTLAARLPIRAGRRASPTGITFTAQATGSVPYRASKSQAGEGSELKTNDYQAAVCTFCIVIYILSLSGFVCAVPD